MKESLSISSRVFGAAAVRRLPGPGGRLMHSLVRVGDSFLMLNDHFPGFGGQPAAEGNGPLVLNLYVPVADATGAQAMAGGGAVVCPIVDRSRT